MQPVFQNLNYKPKKRLSDELPIEQSHQKWYRKFSSSRRVTRRQVIMRHFTSNGTGQHCPLSYLGWQLLNQPFLVYVLFSFHSKTLLFPTSRLQLFCGFFLFFAFPPPSPIPSSFSSPFPSSSSCVGVWECVYVRVFIARNRAIWHCHPIHSMVLELVLLRGEQ